MNNTNEWHSVTASVDRETRDHLTQAAAIRNTTVASLIKRALKVYLSPEVKDIAEANQMAEEQMILKAVTEFARSQEEKSEPSLMDLLHRLNFCTSRVLSLVSGKNDALCRQVLEQADKHVAELQEKRRKRVTDASA